MELLLPFTFVSASCHQNTALQLYLNIYIVPLKVNFLNLSISNWRLLLARLCINNKSVDYTPLRTIAL